MRTCNPVVTINYKLIEKICQITNPFRKQTKRLKDIRSLEIIDQFADVGLVAGCCVKYRQ